MLTNLIGIIILEYICVSSHYIVYLKLTHVICHLYLNKPGKKEKNHKKEENKHRKIKLKPDSVKIAPTNIIFRSQTLC